MLPNFLIIGAMKSGTTSLAKYLSSHPDVFISTPKEPGFFVEELNWEKGLNWYQGLFKDATHVKAVGEASTHYTKRPHYNGVEERIMAVLDNPKFIYIMRDPVQRAISHYWHNVQFHNEHRPIEKAITSDSEYVNFSRYTYQLERYLQYFSPESFLFISYEALKKTPEEVMFRCFRFLAVDAAHVPDNLSIVYNKTPEEIKKTVGLIHKIRWSKAWTGIAPFFPAGLKEKLKKLEYIRVRKEDRISERLTNRLKSLFQPEYEFINTHIGDAS